jgi:DNA polymerase-4
MMDVTGTTRLFGMACDVAAKVQQEVLERYQLEGVAGVGSNKLIAQTAAALIAPSELYDVCPGSEPMFMSPLLVRTLQGLHRPCMRKFLERLDDLNLLTLGAVADSSTRWKSQSVTTPVSSPAGHKGSIMPPCSIRLFNRVLKRPSR